MDALGFYVKLLFFMAPIAVASWIVVGDGRGSFSGLIQIVIGTIAIVPGLAASVRLIWRRFAEKYELTAAALIVDYGYKELLIPLLEVAELRLDVLARPESAAKRVYLIRFDDPTGERRFVEVAPVDSEGFVDALLARCPQLTSENDAPCAIHPGEPAPT